MSTGSAAPARVDLAGAARSGVIGLLGSGGAAVAGLLLNVVIGRGLGTAASGAFFTVVAVLTVAATLSKLGGDTGLVWALARARTLGRPGELRPVLLVALLPSVLAGALLAVAVHFSAPWIAGLVDDGGAIGIAGMLRQGAPFLVIAGPVLVVAAGLRGLGSIAAFTAVQNLLVPGLRPLLAGAVLLAGGGLAGVLLSWNLPLVVGVAVGALLVQRKTARLAAAPAREPARPLPVVAGEFWRFSSWRAAGAAIEVVIVWADVVIVAALTTPAQAGIYAAASRFITTGTLADAAVRIAMAPQIAAVLAVDDRAAAARLCGTATQWIVLLSWPVYLCLALYSPFALSAFGPGFTEGATALSLLAVAMMVMMAAGNNQTVLLMSGRSGWQTGNRVLVLAVNIGLNLWLVPSMGMMGAAVAWSVSSVLDALLAMAEVRWLIRVPVPLRRSLPAAAISLAAFVPIGLVVRFAAGGGTWASLGGILAGTAVFACLVVLVRRRLDIAPIAEAIPFLRRLVPPTADGGDQPLR